MIGRALILLLALLVPVLADLDAGPGNAVADASPSGSAAFRSPPGNIELGHASMRLPASSPARAPAADPSGTPMPRGNLPRWRQIFADNFANRTVPLGGRCGDPNGFPRQTRNWSAYPYPWAGTPAWGTYCPQRTTSIHDGVMDIWLHSESSDGHMLHLIDAVSPRIVGYPNSNGQTYGRYAVRYYQPAAFGSFHLSWLLWPDSGVWPADGEIDFPEGDTNSTIWGFMHWRDATSHAEQHAFPTGVPVHGRWHTATIEWLPSRVTFRLDGRIVGNTTDATKIPGKSMHFVIQNGGSNAAGSPNDADQGHILIDWVTVYAPRVLQAGSAPPS